MANNSFGSFDGTNSFGSFGSSSNSVDLNDPNVLLSLAQMRGGAVSQAAEELMHPQKSLLSTMGDGFKNAFSGFVDVISTPSEVVAGILSQKYSISDAIKKNIKPSDVIFGSSDPKASTMQKVGGFVVRTATDILTDPLTYVTFGAGKGIFGLRSTPSIVLTGEAAKTVGIEAGFSKALSDEGFDVYKMLKNYENQSKGLSSVANIADGGETFKLAKEELENILKVTIDAPLSEDYAKQAMGNLLAKFPQLANTLIDKGGVKFFGNTLLEGQRISAGLHAIPGMTWVDNYTKQTRLAIGGLFNPAIVKADGQYVKLPDEFMEIQQKAKDLAESLGNDKIKELFNVVKGNNLTTTEAKYLTACVEAGKMPADVRLANAFKQLTGFSENELKYIQEHGANITGLENHVPHVLTSQGVGKAAIPMYPPSTKWGATMKRKLEGSIFQTQTPEDLTKLSDIEKALIAKDEKFAQTTLSTIKSDGFEVFDDNIVSALAKRSLDNVKSGTMKEFAYNVASRLGKPASEAPTGWIKVDSKAIKDAVKNTLKNGEDILGYDELGIPISRESNQELLSLVSDKGEEILFHPAIAKKIETFMGTVINDAPTSDMLKSFDSLQNLWKASVTSIFPSFHGRNAISNVFQHFLDLGVHSLNPANHAQAVSMVYSDRKLNGLQKVAAGTGEVAINARNEIADILSKPAFTDNTGSVWTMGQLRQVIKEKGIAFSPNITGQIDVQKGSSAFIDTLFGAEKSLKGKAKKALPLSQEFVPFEYGRQVGQAIEEQARLMDFLANLKNTGDPTHAAMRTKQFLFDYTNLSPFEKTFLKRVIPFYTFTRKNIELQAKTLMTTPGRVSAEIKAVQNLGEVLSGGKLSDEDKAKLPDWVKSGISVLAEKRGSTVTMISTLGTPIEQPFSALQPNVFLGSISPLLRVPFEQMSGYSMYQGKMLSDVTNASAFKKAPPFIKEFIGYTEISGKHSDGTPFTWNVSLRPDRMNLLLNLPPTTRVLSALKQMDAVDVSTQNKIMQQLVGVRPYSFDLEQEQQKREKEMSDKLQSLLNKAGVIAQFKKTFIPKENQ